MQWPRRQRGGGSGPRDGTGGSATAEAEQGGTRLARRDGRGAQHAQHHERRPHAEACVRSELARARDCGLSDCGGVTAAKHTNPNALVK